VSPVPEEVAQQPSRRVLVTGGASGLGAALVRAYVARGADVLVADIAPVVEEGRGTSPVSKPLGTTSYLQLDVRSEEDWAAALSWVTEHWGGLDVLVNNAGVAGGGRVDVATMDEWEWITEINLFGVVRGTRTFVPMLKQQRAGQVVNIASLAGLVHPAGMASYNAVKAGVVAFTETLGHELAAYGVRASVVCPSYFRTGLVDAMQGEDKAVGAVIGQLVANAPLGPDDIAAAILAGLDDGAELILPDDAARQAYALKLADRPAYDALMRKQAARLDQASSR
jgi:NAD(P)-dependent dehydrogenase (short-subunit alcohol dehydrogenase family)